uniref:Uncharacterized protein n=1 Tax=Arundo donax TaxID=35708 RepID=A0A0A8Z0E4_ARUDO
MYCILALVEILGKRRVLRYLTGNFLTIPGNYFWQENIKIHRRSSL